MTTQLATETDFQKAHDHLLDILIQVDEIAWKNHIHYVLDAGTLLGAVRHGGFIPWDDDLDIALTRRDFKKLKKACQNELGSNYFWQDKFSDKNFPLDIAKVRRSNTNYVEKRWDGLSIHHGIYIDIFPMDKTIPLFHGVQGGWLRFWQRVRARKLGLAPYANSRLEKVLSSSVSVFLMKLIPNLLLKWLIEISIRALNFLPLRFVNKLSHWGLNRPIYPMSLFMDSIDGDFEGHKFPIPRNYDLYLRQRYGNYLEMPSKEQRKPSHNIVSFDI